MKRVIITSVVALVVFAGCDIRKHDKQQATALQQTSTTTDNTKTLPNVEPTMVQMIDSVHNFGAANEGDIVEFSFRFKNVGQKPLIVSNAHASCGCTVPEKPEQPIMPGADGFIKVKFDSKGRPGKAHKTVTVTSNAQPEFPLLVLEGDVTAKKQ